MTLLPLLVLLATSFAGCHSLVDEPTPGTYRPPDLLPPRPLVPVDVGTTPPPPIAILTATVDGDTVTAYLRLLDAQPIDAWTLDWDDGGPPSEGGALLPDQLTHSYQNDGHYTLSLVLQTTHRQHVNATTTVTIGEVQTDTRQRFLTATPTDGPAPLAVRMTVDTRALAAADKRASSDTKAPHTIAAWAIDFGDGSPAQGGRFNPPTTLQHIYTRTGTFELRLFVLMATDSTYTSAVPIIVRPPDDIEAWSLHVHAPQLRATDADGTTIRNLTLPDGGTCATCWRPVALEPVDTRLAILVTRGDEAGALWVIDRISGREVGFHTIADAPTSFQADPQGHLWITHRADPALTIIDPETGDTTRLAIGPTGRTTHLAFDPSGTTGFAIQSGHGGSIAQLRTDDPGRTPHILPAPIDARASAYDTARRTLAMLDNMTGDVLLVREGTTGPQPHGFVDLETGDTSIPVAITCSNTDEGCWALHYETVSGQGILSTFLPSTRLQTQRDPDKATPIGLDPSAVRLAPGLRTVDMRLLDDQTLVIGTRDREGRPGLILIDREDLNSTRTVALAPDAQGVVGTTVGIRTTQHPEQTHILYWQDPMTATWGAVDLAEGRTITRHATPAPLPLGFHVVRATTAG